MSPIAPSAAAVSTTPVPSEPQRSVHAAPPRRHSRVAIWVGASVAILGALLAIAGGALLAVFGTDGVASTGRHDLFTPTSALVSGTASINTADFAKDLGSARIRINAQAIGDRRVFVGVGRARDVDRYLAGAATDEVTDFDASPFESAFTVHTRRHAGAAIPAPPGRQSFWVVRGSGRNSTSISWKVRHGRYRVVIMNADGSRGVATQTKFGVSVPYASGIGLGILIGGVLLIAVGIVAIVAGARRPRN
jgi:hypothetical protein